MPLPFVSEAGLQQTKLIEKQKNKKLLCEADFLCSPHRPERSRLSTALETQPGNFIYL